MPSPLLHVPAACSPGPPTVSAHGPPGHWRDHRPLALRFFCKEESAVTEELLGYKEEREPGRKEPPFWELLSQSWVLFSPLEPMGPWALGELGVCWSRSQLRLLAQFVSMLPPLPWGPWLRLTRGMMAPPWSPARSGTLSSPFPAGSPWPVSHHLAGKRALLESSWRS